MKLDKSPFVVVSVVGQELLTHGFNGASVVVLEAGLKIGTCSLKLRGSVFSALSSAYWALGNAEKSMTYMQQDLEVTKTLGTGRKTAIKHKYLQLYPNECFELFLGPSGDQSGECRAHGNLGSALFSKGSYREALANHRNQLVLAMKLKDREVGMHAKALWVKEMECALTRVHLIFHISALSSSTPLSLHMLPSWKQPWFQFTSHCYCYETYMLFMPALEEEEESCNYLYWPQ